MKSSVCYSFGDLQGSLDSLPVFGYRLDPRRIARQRPMTRGEVEWDLYDFEEEVGAFYCRDCREGRWDQSKGKAIVNVTR